VSGSADANAAYPLQLTVDGVTPAWLSAALRTRYPDVVVTVAERFEVVEGTATKLLFALRYDGNDTVLPERMWIKGGFGPSGPGRHVRARHETADSRTGSGRTRHAHRAARRDLGAAARPAPPITGPASESTWTA
jgi:hypothetical protein